MKRSFVLFFVSYCSALFSAALPGGEEMRISLSTPSSSSSNSPSRAPGLANLGAPIRASVSIDPLAQLAALTSPGNSPRHSDTDSMAVLPGSSPARSASQRSLSCMILSSPSQGIPDDLADLESPDGDSDFRINNEELVAELMNLVERDRHISEEVHRRHISQVLEAAKLKDRRQVYLARLTRHAALRKRTRERSIMLAERHHLIRMHPRLDEEELTPGEGLITREGGAPISVSEDDVEPAIHWLAAKVFKKNLTVAGYEIDKRTMIGCFTTVCSFIAANGLNFLVAYLNTQFNA